MKNKIRTVREKTLLSQHQVSYLLLITVHTYIAIEQGKLPPSDTILEMLCRIYGLPRSFFTMRDEDFAFALNNFLKMFDQLNNEERFQKCFFNLVGEKIGKCPYRQISKVKQSICKEKGFTEEE